MRRVADPVERRIPHVQIRRRHVDLRPQHVRPVRKLSRAHAGKQIEALLDRPVAVRAVAARLGQRAAMSPDFLPGEAVDVGLVAPDELDGERVEPLEVIGREQQLIPLKAEPRDVFLDGVDVFDVFLGRIGVVEPQVARAAVLGGDAEVQTNRLGVSDVQIAVRLGRKTGRDPAVVFAGGEVLFHDRADEIDRSRRRGRSRVVRRVHRHVHFIGNRPTSEPRHLERVANGSRKGVVPLFRRHATRKRGTTPFRFVIVQRALSIPPVDGRRAPPAPRWGGRTPRVAASTAPACPERRRSAPVRRVPRTPPPG